VETALGKLESLGEPSELGTPGEAPAVPQSPLRAQRAAAARLLAFAWAARFRSVPKGSFVGGYFGNITALGLASAKLHPETVLGWMRWYASHAHGSGSGVDGVADDATLRRDGSFRTRCPDSTDAYAGFYARTAAI
jgi:hypothetical protein